MDDSRVQIERVVQFFGGSDGRENYERLLHFAHTEIVRHRWCSAWRSTPPGGKGAVDFVNELLRQVLQEDGAGDRRRIPPDVPIDVALRWHVRSKISAAVRSFENRRCFRVGDLVNGDGFFDSLPTGYLYSGVVDAFECSDELATMTSERCQRFIDFVAEDSVLHAMLLLIRDLSIDGPADRITGVVCSTWFAFIPILVRSQYDVSNSLLSLRDKRV